MQRSGLNRTNVELKLRKPQDIQYRKAWLESNQCGIETRIARLTIDLEADGLNRTNVELKHGSTVVSSQVIWSLNRTNVELKPLVALMIRPLMKSLNRTNVELKHNGADGAFEYVHA